MSEPSPFPARIPWKPLVWLTGAALLVFILAEAPFLYRFTKSRVFLVRAQRAASPMLARFWASEALRADAGFVPATEFLADLYEAEGSPLTLSWRIRAAQLQPGNSDASLKWAKAALLAGNIEMAAHALDLIPDRERNQAAYHSLKAGVDLRAGRKKEAEKHFAEAIRLDPQNTLYAINQAVAAMESADPEITNGARRRLVQLEKNPDWGIHARRALVDDAMRRGDWKDATDRSDRICQMEKAQIVDWVNLLTSIRADNPARFPKVLKQTQLWLQSHPQDLSFWMNWMRRNGKGEEALAWADALPPEQQKALPVHLARADILAHLKNWEELHRRISSEDWPGFDFARQMLLSRSLRELHRPEADEAWKKTWSLLKDKPMDLLLAAQLLTSWQWHEETETVWWRLAQISPQHRTWAWNQLNHYYHLKGNTPGLLLVALKTLQERPEDPVAQNNYAFLALLSHQDEKRAGELASNVYRRYPLHPASASTYAFFLHKQGRHREGLEAIQRLTQEQRNDPGVALYEGLLLAAEQRPAEATICFAKAATGTPLPEEKKWLTDFGRPPEVTGAGN